MGLSHNHRPRAATTLSVVWLKAGALKDKKRSSLRCSTLGVTLSVPQMEKV